MKVYEGANVRNVALVGHGDAGKTSLVSAMLYTAGATQRLGRVDDGSTVTDFDEEEVARSMSISTSLAYAEWGKTKLNFLDTPGFTLFAHEAKTAMVAAESALVVVDGVSGVEAVGEPQLVRRFPRKALPRVPPQGLLPDVDPRTPATTSEEGTKEYRLDEREGVGEAGAGGRSAVRLCTLGAQSPLHAEGGVYPGGGEGTDRAGLRAERVDLFQDLQEPGASDRTGDRYGGSHARLGQVARVLSGDDLH